MSSSIQINASTSRDRHAVVAEVHDALAEAGAWVTDFHQFSNLSACISFEVEGARLGGIEQALTSAGLHITPRSAGELRGAAFEGTVEGSVQITFFHDEGDLRVPVAAVPG